MIKMSLCYIGIYSANQFLPPCQYSFHCFDGVLAATGWNVNAPKLCTAEA